MPNPKYAEEMVRKIGSCVKPIMRKRGWKKGEPWGRKVKLPEGLDRQMLGINNSYVFAEWFDSELDAFGSKSTRSPLRVTC